MMYAMSYDFCSMYAAYVKLCAIYVAMGERVISGKLGSSTSWWFFPTHPEKYAIVKLDHETPILGMKKNNKKYFKPPPRVNDHIASRAGWNDGPPFSIGNSSQPEVFTLNCLAQPVTLASRRQQPH